jgi:hypothetical protein
VNDTSTPTYRVATVTPDLAREWLKRNSHNRHLGEQRVFTLADAMKRGEWQENGDAIRFSRTGVLLDGQHRLAAVVKSRVTIRVLVVEDLPDDVQITIDTGKPRSFSNVLKLGGISDPNNVAALARWMYRWETGQIRSQNRPPSHNQLLHIVETNLPSIRESLRVASGVRRQIPVPKSIVGIAHWVFSEIAMEDTPDFFDRLRDGTGLTDGAPTLMLRQTLLREAASNSRQMTDKHILALFIKAWNAYRAGELIQVLRWRAGGAAPEPFPEPK